MPREAGLRLRLTPGDVSVQKGFADRTCLLGVSCREPSARSLPVDVVMSSPGSAYLGSLG